MKPKQEEGEKRKFWQFFGGHDSKREKKAQKQTSEMPGTSSSSAHENPSDSEAHIPKITEKLLEYFQEQGMREIMTIVEREFSHNKDLSILLIVTGINGQRACQQLLDEKLRSIMAATVDANREFFPWLKSRIVKSDGKWQFDYFINNMLLQIGKNCLELPSAYYYNLAKEIGREEREAAEKLMRQRENEETDDESLQPKKEKKVTTEKKNKKKINSVPIKKNHIETFEAKIRKQLESLYKNITNVVVEPKFDVIAEEKILNAYAYCPLECKKNKIKLTRRTALKDGQEVLTSFDTSAFARHLRMHEAQFKQIKDEEAETNSEQSSDENENNGEGSSIKRQKSTDESDADTPIVKKERKSPIIVEKPSSSSKKLVGGKISKKAPLEQPSTSAEKFDDDTIPNLQDFQDKSSFDGDYDVNLLLPEDNELQEKVSDEDEKAEYELDFNEKLSKYKNSQNEHFSEPTSTKKSDYVQFTPPLYPQAYTGASNNEKSKWLADTQSQEVKKTKSFKGFPKLKPDTQ